MHSVTPRAEPTHPTQTFNAEALTPLENYKLLAGSVVPRPIAWVSTVSATGIRNLAPYSFFTVVSANPPVLCFCPSVREEKNGLSSVKDTLANIRATGEFVVNIVSQPLVQAMNQTAAQLAPDGDEFVLAGLTALPGEAVRAPRVAEAPIQMECRLHQIVEVSPLPMGGVLVLGQILRFHIRASILGPDLHIDPDQLQAIGRMAGSDYVRTQDRFALERPK